MSLSRQWEPVQLHRKDVEHQQAHNELRGWYTHKADDHQGVIGARAAPQGRNNALAQPLHQLTHNGPLHLQPVKHLVVWFKRGEVWRKECAIQREKYQRHAEHRQLTFSQALPDGWCHQHRVCVS